MVGRGGRSHLLGEQRKWRDPMCAVTWFAEAPYLHIVELSGIKENAINSSHSDTVIGPSWRREQRNLNACFFAFSNKPYMFCNDISATGAVLQNISIPALSVFSTDTATFLSEIISRRRYLWRKKKHVVKWIQKDTSAFASAWAARTRSTRICS